MSMDPLAIAILLLVIAFGLLVAELFVPSGGILAIVTACVAAAAIYYAFRVSFETGLSFLLLVLVSIPVLGWLFVKVWPNTSMGRRMLGELPRKQVVRWASTSQVHDIGELIGRTGKTLTEMLPAGQIEIDGLHFDALTEGQTLGVGALVRVLKIDMGRLLVAEYLPSEESMAPAKENSHVPSDPVSINSSSSNFKDGSLDPLDQPIEELGLESLDDPNESPPPASPELPEDR